MLEVSCLDLFVQMLRAFRHCSKVEIRSLPGKTGKRIKKKTSILVLSQLLEVINCQGSSKRRMVPSKRFPPALDSREHSSYRPVGSWGRVWFSLESWWHWSGLSGLKGSLPGVWRSSFQFYRPPPVNRSTVQWFLRLGKVTIT